MYYDARVRTTFPDSAGPWSNVATAFPQGPLALGEPRAVAVTISDTMPEEGDTVTLTATLDEPAPREGTTVQFWAYGNTIGGTVNGATVLFDYTLSPPDPGREYRHGRTGRMVTSINNFTTDSIRIGPGRTTATAELEVVLNEWTGRQSCTGTSRPELPSCTWIYAPITESAEGIGVYAAAKVPDPDHKHDRRALTSPTVTMTIYDVGQSPTVSGNQGSPPEQETVTLPSSVTLALGQTSVSESGGTVTVTATLDAPAPADGNGVSLGLYAGGSSTATRNSDYTMPDTIAIAAGQRSGTASIVITNDAVDESDETVTVGVFADTGYATLAADTTLTITDDDTAGVSITAANPFSVSEGATATYTVVLDSQPTADVTVAASSGDTGAASVSPASRVFTATNWNTAQTFTVSGVADTDTNDETVGISHSVTSTDTQYANTLVSTVSVSVSDTTTPPRSSRTGRPRWQTPSPTPPSSTRVARRRSPCRGPSAMPTATA